MAKQRPQARTVNELRAFLESGHERLVCIDEVHVAWLGSSAELSQALGLKRQAMTSRLRTLRSAGVAETSIARRIVFDLDRLTELATGVRHLRVASATEQFRNVVGEKFEEQRSADGTVAYRHRESGQRASLRDLTRAAGYESPSSTQYHLKVLADASADTRAGVADQIATTPGVQEGPTRNLAHALTELTALLAAADSDHGLQTTILDAIASVSRTGQSFLMSLPNSRPGDASFSRGSRPDDATTRCDHDFELPNSDSFSEPQTESTRANVARVAARDKDASHTRRPHVAPKQRQLDEPVPLTDEKLAGIFAPLVAVVERSHPNLTPNWKVLSSAAAPWPIGDLSAAIGKLTGQLDASWRAGKRPIDNPYAVFTAAAKRGDLEYFSVRFDESDGPDAGGGTNRDSTGVASHVTVSEASIRSCLIADLERSDRSVAIDALIAQCKVSNEFEALADVARRVVLEVVGEDGIDYFDRQWSGIGPPPSTDTNRLSKDERRAILGGGRSRLGLEDGWGQEDTGVAQIS